MPYISNAQLNTLVKSSMDEGFYKFIEVNKTYFKDLVREYPFGEVHYYVEQQLDWYCGNHPDDELWEEMHEEMNGLEVKYEWFDAMAHYIYDQYK